MTSSAVLLSLVTYEHVCCQKKPKEVAKLMDTLRDNQGKRVFAASECLTQTQIQAWFSAYARKRKETLTALHVIADHNKNKSQ